MKLIQACFPHFIATNGTAVGCLTFRFDRQNIQFFLEFPDFSCVVQADLCLRERRPARRATDQCHQADDDDAVCLTPQGHGHSGASQPARIHHGHGVPRMQGQEQCWSVLGALRVDEKMTGHAPAPEAAPSTPFGGPTPPFRFAARGRSGVSASAAGTGRAACGGKSETGWAGPSVRISASGATAPAESPAWAGSGAGSGTRCWGDGAGP